MVVAIGFEEYIAPQKAKLPQVRHQFYVEGVDIYCLDPSVSSGNPWKPYEIYEALTVYDSSLFPDLAGVDLSTYKQGMWQRDDGSRFNKLRILSQNSLSYAASGGNLPENFNVTTESLFCVKPEKTKTCIQPKNYAFVRPDGTLVYMENSLVYTNGLLIRMKTADGKIVTQTHAGLSDPLAIGAEQEVELFFNEPVVRAELYIQTIVETLDVSAFAWIDSGNVDLDGLPIFDYTDSAFNQSYIPSTLPYPIVVENLSKPFAKILIETGKCPGHNNPPDPNNPNQQGLHTYT